MTVAELIARLNAMPKDAVVLTPGFDESGFECPRVELRDMFSFTQGDRYRGEDRRDLIAGIGKTEFKEEPAGIPVKAVVVDFGGERATHEQQGTGYDSGATSYELQGRKRS